MIGKRGVLGLRVAGRNLNERRVSERKGTLFSIIRSCEAKR